MESLIQETLGLKVFHGCRPQSVDSYYKNGFLVKKSEWLKNSLFELFPDIGNDLKQKAFESVYSLRKDEDVKTYFIADTARFINGGSGHYLIYGSEFILSATRFLEDRLNMPLIHRLKTTGVPTIFEVDIPYRLLTKSEIQDLACVLLSAWGKWHLFPQELYSIEFVVITREQLNAEHIVGHSHPETIMDRIQRPPELYRFNP